MESGPGVRRWTAVVFCTTFVLLCAGAWLVSGAPGDPAATAETEDVASGETSAALRHAGPANGAVQTAARRVDTKTVTAAAPDTETETVAQYATEKYELLLEDLGDLPPEKFAALNLALLKREQLTGAGRNAEGLALADADVKALLPSSDHATFDTLKGADAELFALDQFAGGVGNVAPLGAEERKSILRTKLAYKDRFRQLVADSDLSREGLSAAEREQALAVTSRALERYRDDYLAEVRQYLGNDEQFALLRNFESTEFSAGLDELRAKAL